MKAIIPALAAAVVGGAIVYGLVGRASDTDLARKWKVEEERWAAEKAQLESDLRAARRIPSKGNANEPAAALANAAQPSAEEILEKLKSIRANARDPRSVRKVIYHLEQLREIGPAALPPIRAFLARFEDVDYLGVRPEQERQNETNATENRGGAVREELRERTRQYRDWNRIDERMRYATPPSLRMGLFEVVQGIGGLDAEAVLANVLGETGRPVELAYTAKLLEEMVPKKYASAAIAAAKDLLVNPMQGTTGDRLDETGKDYLYHILVKLGDTTFVSQAQGMVVLPNGEIDRRALAYLDQTLKEQAMPAIFAAYQDPRITNQMDKASLMNMALKHAGPNQQANQMLNSVVGDESTPTALRAMAIASLTRGEPTPETIQARLPVVEALKGSTTDERLLRALDATHQNLQNMLAGKPADENAMREAIRGGLRAGDFEGRRNRESQGPRSEP